jgi:hypothetical protein
MGMKVRVKNSRPINRMFMRKEINTHIVTYKKRYEKKGYYFLYFEHKNYKVQNY